MSEATASLPAKAAQHTAVFLHEAVDALVTDPAGTYVDGTFGRGGHSRLLLQRLAPAGRLLALDRDPEAVSAAAEVKDARFSIHHANFAELPGVLGDVVDDCMQLAVPN